MGVHCATCRCEPETGYDLTIYPPNEILYGRCETCGQVRWGTDMFDLWTRDHGRALHCGCCTHPHDLEPGGHLIAETERHRGHAGQAHPGSERSGG